MGVGVPTGSYNADTISSSVLPEAISRPDSWQWRDWNVRYPLLFQSLVRWPPAWALCAP